MRSFLLGEEIEETLNISTMQEYCLNLIGTRLNEIRIYREICWNVVGNGFLPFSEKEGCK